MQEVTLMQMLEARERRVWEQQTLLSRFGKPIVCFTMNIPGPVKQSPLIARSFRFGCAALEARIPAQKLLYRSADCAVTGCQAMYCADLDAMQLKRICTAIEDETPLGRLFDMDVLLPDGSKLDRELVGGGSRDCIVCGAPGRGCASRRVHSVAELQQAVHQCMQQHFAEPDAAGIAAMAVNALIDEVETTPKPGLVDLRNTGSHWDMDVPMFRRSAEALRGYFLRCVKIGMDSADNAPEETFARLRPAGIVAEKQMLAATNGVNTHKGAIFTMGLICGAAGRLWKPDAPIPAEELFPLIRRMTEAAMAADFARMQGSTAGERLYAARGIRGVRGEAAAGFPSISKIGLPAFRQLRQRGFSQKEAGMQTLLQLIVHVEDTNLQHRGGEALARAAVEKTRRLLDGEPTLADVEALDDWFIEHNLSPGGCADLLAAVYFLDMLERQE